MIFGILELLQKLRPKTFRTPCSILQDAEERRKSPGIERSGPAI